MAELGSEFQYSQLRIFAATGTELAKTTFDDYQASPEEAFSSFNDPYIEFTAAEAGIYYAGISQIGNEYYDPFTVGSGSGWVFPDFGIAAGQYTVGVSIV